MRLSYLAFGLFCLGLAWFAADTRWSLFLESYLFSTIYWLNITLGAIALRLLHYLTSGVWGKLLGPFLEAASNTVIPMIFLVIPVLLGIPHLYPWARAQEVLSDVALQQKTSYLNPSFFVVRSLVYALTWVLIAKAGRRIGAGLSLVLYGFSASFAAMDWLMSLEPHWYSTVYGMLFMVTQALSALAFCVFALATQSQVKADLQRKWDLGNLLLTFVVLWTYLQFVQYLIIWSGNLPEEVSWFVKRSQFGWQWIALALGLFQFAFPFFLLLFRKLKGQESFLAWIAGWILFMRILDTYWLIVPSFHRSNAVPRIADLLCWVGIGGIWLGTYLSILAKGKLDKEVT